MDSRLFFKWKQGYRSNLYDNENLKYKILYIIFLKNISQVVMNWYLLATRTIP